MTIETDLFDRLTAAGLTVYPVEAAQGAAYPYVVYRKISALPVQSVDGPSGLDRARFQIDSYSDSYLEAKTTAASVRTALDGYSGTFNSLFDSERDLLENERVRRVSMDFFLWHGV